jgi:phenylalanyl-tRNA synthetase beta chain
MILPEDAPIGVPFSTYLGKTDTVFDLEITPNRPDCLCVTGFAREVGAMYQCDWSNPLADDAAKMQPVKGDAALEDIASVSIEDDERCPRYTARVIKNVKVGPSPDWLVERLSAIGQRSINNIVDITNYILFLYGQPLHAFDFDKIKNAEGKANIVVRPAEEGAEFVTLDGQTRTLTQDMTVIATPEAGVVALAGVMGGLNSEVDETTTTILLESATFNPGRTSRTSRNLGLISESSMRYERRVDDHGCDIRGAAAAALMVELAGGEVVASANNEDAIIDVWKTVSDSPELNFRINRFCDFVGAEIPEDFIVDCLSRLGCTVASKEQGELTVVAPTFRPDLEREIDLYEEVLRLWGMDKIEPTLPRSPKRIGFKTDVSKFTKKLNDVLSASGLNETMTYSFASVDDMLRLGFGEDLNDSFVELLNPLNSDHAVMRQSILPSLLRSLAYNQSHGVKSIKLYEIGTVFKAIAGKEKPKERKRVSAVMAGLSSQKAWNDNTYELGFYDAKGIVENLIRELAIPKARFKVADTSEYPFLQPGRAAEVYSGGQLLGVVGELHPLVSKEFEVDGSVAVFDFDFDALKKCSAQARPYKDVTVFPSIEVDQNFVVGDDVTHEKMIQVITSAGGKLLDDVRLFDIFRDDEKIGKGKKSMAYSLIYKSPERTLTQEEVNKAHERVVKKVASATGAEVRG